MGRTTIPGIYRGNDGNWHVDKIVRGQRLRNRFGGDYAEAESWVLDQIQRLKQTPTTGRRYTFEQAATHYVQLYQDKPSLEDEIRHIHGLLPHIGKLYLDQIYDATLQPYIEARRHAVVKVGNTVRTGVKSKTINLALGTVRHILNLAARAWRDDNGRTWLAQAPLITMIDGGDEDEPKQLTWKQQREHLQKLPAHLANMALFTLQCGARDSVVCGLRWEWEVKIPELEISVFNVPRQAVKGRKRNRVLVCNSVAQRIIESVRGRHDDYVFVYSQIRKADKTPAYRPIETMNNTAWQRWRDDSGLAGFSPHDLRHTVGMRLREAGVNDETRADILWHTRKGMPQHYAVAQIVEIREALEKITDERHGWNKSLSAIMRDAADEVPTKVPAAKK